MSQILVTGAGKIGTLIACLLASTEDYQVHLMDISVDHFDKDQLGDCADKITLHALDVQQSGDLEAFLSSHHIDAVISSLLFFCNVEVAAAAKANGCHYFDLTEDTAVTDCVRELAEGAQKAFVPQCGLAPGFISIAANDCIGHFDTLEAVLLRVGALPVHPNNALKYSLTWSTDGVINEYGNPCYGIQNFEHTVFQPLEGLETVEIDGLLYEAFNTSGGLGSLGDTYAGKVETMNYKTLRYPGHCEKMKLLMNDLKLNQDRDTLKRILENAVPRTTQDVVLVYVAVRGQREGQLYEETFVKKVYPETIAGKLWSAIQVTTAAGVCAVFDLVMQAPEAYHGFVTQEQFTLDAVLANRFGRYYAVGD